MAEHSAENARVPDGTKAICKGTMPGVPSGTPCIVRDASPSGHTNLDRHPTQHPLYWLELDDFIYWSHGRSDAKGYWGTAAEFEVSHA